MLMKGLSVFRWGPLLVLFLALPVMAQDAASGDASMRDVLEGDEALDRLIKEKSVDGGFTAAQADTPLAALLGLEKYYKQGDFTAAAEYLDLRYLPDEVADFWTPEELIRAIDVIWGQQNILDITSVSDDPQGHLNDGLPEYRDLLGMVVLGDEKIPVYLQRVPGEGADGDQSRGRADPPRFHSGSRPQHCGQAVRARTVQFLQDRRPE